MLDLSKIEASGHILVIGGAARAHRRGRGSCESVGACSILSYHTAALSIP